MNELEIEEMKKSYYLFKTNGENRLFASLVIAKCPEISKVYLGKLAKKNKADLIIYMGHILLSEDLNEIKELCDDHGYFFDIDVIDFEFEIKFRKKQKAEEETVVLEELRNLESTYEHEDCPF